MAKVNALIFDLGGVILNLDQDKTLRAFNRMGANLEELNLASTVFTDFETGKLSEDDFRQVLKTALHGRFDDAQIDHAWNAMLLDIPRKRIELLIKLRKHFRIHLLSNSNSIHITYFHEWFNQHFGSEYSWNELFDTIFYSHEIGLRKPTAACYEYVLNAINESAEKCVFIDDSHINIRGAESVGIRTLWAKEPLNETMLHQLKAVITSETPYLN
jgi:HAD superfamily hydrolase (TIGR01509 family)